MNNQTTINWSQAQEVSKQTKITKQIQDQEYKENLKIANTEIWEALGSSDFRHGDFEQICMENGVEQDDLLNMLI